MEGPHREKEICEGDDSLSLTCTVGCLWGSENRMLHSRDSEMYESLFFHVNWVMEQSNGTILRKQVTSVRGVFEHRTTLHGGKHHQVSINPWQNSRGRG